MTTKFFALAFTVFLLLAQPPLRFGQTAAAPPTDWTAVQSLALKTNLLIETKDGRQQKGKLNNASADALTLIQNGKTVQFAKADIRKIYRLRGGSRAKTAAIGAAVGAGAGLGIAFILLGATGGSDDTNGIAGTGALIGAGVGAGIGALVGKNSRVLIYESQ